MCMLYAVIVEKALATAGQVDTGTPGEGEGGLNVWDGKVVALGIPKLYTNKDFFDFRNY